MANTIKWSKIEKTKYGLIADWYVSEYYGNDIDIDGAGYYNRTTNPTGHGGPTRPFATDTKVWQDSTVASHSVVVYDSGYYMTKSAKTLQRVGDGTVIFNNNNTTVTVAGAGFLNITLLQGSFSQSWYKDCKCFYSNISIFGAATTNPITERSLFIECQSSVVGTRNLINNCTFINHNGYISNQAGLQQVNNIFIGNSQLRFLGLTQPRASGTIFDYSIIIGAIASTNIPINGKTTGVTVKDFKADGNYFVRSYSEVDLFGNLSGSGATVPQLQTLFNNYFSPVYLDTWQDLDLSLKPTASNMIKFGGLNGTYIGALPVGHYFSGQTLWDNYKDAVNTSNIDYDMLSKGLVITPGQEFGTFRSARISLGAPYILEPINFFANLVYNSDGTPRQGVSNQRIDTTPDDLPDNTKNQRVVYDFKLQYSETVGGVLTPFLNFEPNRTPEIDNSGRSNLDDAFVALERQKIKVADFIIELTLRRIIID